MVNRSKKVDIKLTSPLKPSFENLMTNIRLVYDNDTLTNMGPFHNEFETKLAKFHGLHDCCLVNNATTGLLLCLKFLVAKGEVITTPFSFAATTHVLNFLDLKPVFCDIEAHSPNLDPSKIERLISKDTTAILATHCYGIPCDVEKIARIAEKYNLKVIYDAAHAFGQRVLDHSIFEFGDASVLSLHATKIFNSIEGGAIFSKKSNLDLLKKARNFGITGDDVFVSLGINAKLSEFHALFGLLNFDEFHDSFVGRKRVARVYKDNLDKAIQVMMKLDGTDNLSYFPIVFRSESERERAYNALKNKGIKSRKYFAPLLSNNKDDHEKFNNAEFLVRRVLCIPIFKELTDQQAKKICVIINEAIYDSDI